MPNTRDISSGGANILLVGDSGTKKTRFLGSCPKPYIFDFDAGQASNRDRDVTYDTFKDIPKFNGAIRPPTEKEKALGFFPYGQAWNGFLIKLNEIGTMIDKGTCPFLTIGLDSLTFLSEIAMANVLIQQKEPVIHQGSYGAQQQYLKTVLSQLTAWPIRLVATAHIQRDVNDITQNTEKLPLLTGKLAGLIGAFFDEVYFCETEGEGASKKWLLKTESTQMLRQAKSRWGVPNNTENSYEAVSKFFASPSSIAPATTQVYPSAPPTPPSNPPTLVINK